MKTLRNFLSLSLLLMTLVYANSSWSFSVRYLPLESVVNLSYDIVQGQVTSLEEGVDENGMSVTYVTVQVGEVLKGDPLINNDGTMVFKQANINGVPSYISGKEYVLFLYGESDKYGLRSPVGANQGLVKLSKNSEGELIIKGKSSAKTKMQALVQKNPSKFRALTSVPTNTKADVSYGDFKEVISSLVKEGSR
jgi:hypothetical protein